MKVAKADLVPTEANLLAQYASFAELDAACLRWCEQVNGRPHRATYVAPADRLVKELPKLHVLPDNPHILALGEQRLVNSDQTIG